MVLRVFYTIYPKLSINESLFSDIEKEFKFILQKNPDEEEIEIEFEEGSSTQLQYQYEETNYENQPSIVEIKLP